MHLADACEALEGQGFPGLGRAEHPELGTVLAARSMVTAAVADDEFLLDCFTHELNLLASETPRRGLTPFFTMPDQGIGFAFGYWPPGTQAGAHEHTAWTITAVCRNRLQVHTFDRATSYYRQELVKKNLFDAPAGQVGYIYQPCIHNPVNPTAQWSLSLHVISPRDGLPPDDEYGQQCLPALETLSTCTEPGQAYTRIRDEQNRQQLIRVTAHFVSSMAGQGRAPVIDRCARLGSISTRRFIAGLDLTDMAGIDRDFPQADHVMLVRREPELVLECRQRIDGATALGVYTEAGWIEEFSIAALGAEAVRFATTTPEFSVGELPGPLTSEERWQIAETLEATGLFIPVWPLIGSATLA
ncbi:MAG: hypothetical protein K2Q25_12695 [Mycobacteriaceae bacterium]|nr:hypothetical protein [Mycobacteriaceae bacterium]